MDATSYRDILTATGSYYSAKLDQFGETHKGVDWNSTESQELRFAQLLKVVDLSTQFSLNDFGCGYGHLYDYVSKLAQDFTYVGYDISTKMIESASKRLPFQNCSFEFGQSLSATSDYTVASGIFNVRQNADDDIWLAYILKLLDDMDDHSKRGFSFNCLTKYSDKEYMKDYLYYADPLVLFDHCKRNYSKNVALLHDYGLYEFTILVRK